MGVNIDIKHTTPLFLKPMDSRHMTDKFFILHIPFSLLLCLLIGVNVLLDESVSKNIWQFFAWLSFEYLIYGVTALLVIILFILILNKFKDNWLVFVVTFSIVITILLFIMCILWVLIVSLDSHSSWSLFIVSTIFVAHLIYNVTIFICTREVGVATLGPMLKEPIRAILQSSTVSLFSFAIIVLVTIVFITLVPMTICIASLYAMGDPTMRHSVFSVRVGIFIFGLGGTYVLCFIWNFAFMIMADYFANYYGRQQISRTYIFQSIKTVSRYHLGTIAFFSTPILPTVCAAIMTFSNNQQPGKPSNYKLINFISKISLIANITEYALIQTSVNGSKSLKSIRQTVDLRHKNSLFFLTLNAVSFKIMDLSVIIVTIICFIIVEMFGLQPYFDDPVLIHSASHKVISLELLMLWFYVNIINMLLLRPATCAFAIYKMIDGERESKISYKQSAELSEDAQ